MPAETSPEVGDKVSWTYGSSNPSGTVADKKSEGEVATTSHRGNTIKKSAQPNDPAVELEHSGNNVVKNTSELTVEDKKSNGAKSKAKTPEVNGESDKKDKASATKSPKKRKAPAEEKPAEEPEAKKPRGRPKGAAPKAQPKKAAADGEKKGRGRPKKDGSAPTSGGTTKKKTPRKGTRASTRNK